MKTTMILVLAASVALGVQIPCFALADFWTRAQGPMGGMVQALAADNAGTVLAGTNKPGIFRSTDRGQTWRALNSGLGDLTVVELELFRGAVWIASTWGGANVYRSTNMGTNWIVVHRYSIRPLRIL